MHARVNKEIIPEEELENAFGEKMTEHQIRREIILASLVNICRGSQVASK